MKPLTLEWVQKAEADFRTACRERNARKEPNFDAACFHVQQCIEKYLKACLQEKNVAFERTHNLIVLLDKVVEFAPLLDSFRTDMAVVSEYAVAYRYPGDAADKSAAVESVNICRSIRQELRRFLRLDD